MQRCLMWGISLGCLVGAVLALLFAPEPLQNWWDTTFGGDMVRWLPHLPVLVLVMVTFWGWHQRQEKVALLASLLLGTHALLVLPLPHGLPSGDVRDGLAVFVPWAFPLLLGFPEANLKSLWGWARLGAAVSVWLGAFIWASNHGFTASLLVHMLWVPGGLKTLSAFLALLALLSLPLGQTFGLRVSWTWALISLGLACLHGEPWWPEPVSSAPWSVFLSFSAFFLLGGLYGLTWRRAYLDELTGLPGRRAFEECLRRLGRHYGIAMIDVDHFKHFNDTYGHQVGDQVLRFIAARLKMVSFGRAFRYGGEEFALVVPGRKAQVMLSLLEGLRRSIETSRLTIRGDDRPLRRPRRSARPAGGKDQVGVTVSIGMARRSVQNPTAEAVVKTADEALYRAKQLGRNRVESERARKPGENDAKRIDCRAINEEDRDASRVRRKAYVGSVAV